MSTIINQNGRLAVKSNFIAASSLSNVTDVISFTSDDLGNIICAHASGRISIGNGIVQNYIQTAFGFLSFPFKTTGFPPIVFAGKFTYIANLDTVRYFAIPSSSGGLMFIALSYTSSTSVTGNSYVIDTSINASTCIQGLNGVSTVVEAYTTGNNPSKIGDGLWLDLAFLTSSGSFLFLNQSYNSLSPTPYYQNPDSLEVSNLWLTSSIGTGATNFTSPKTGVFVFPYASSNAGSTIGFPSWPTLRPVIVATRNFEDYTYRANPNAFNPDGTAKATWSSYAITSVSSIGNNSSNLVLASGPTYIYSLEVI